MTSKLKIAGWVALGALAGGLTTLQFGATARNTVSPHWKKCSSSRRSSA
jgi:carboxyl-terminal processing protease